MKCKNRKDSNTYAHKILIFYHSGGEILKDERGIPVASLCDQALPMLTRARFGFEMPEYLEEVYRSPHGYVVVCKILHENLPS